MRYRILVVEDELAIREMICFALNQSGYETQEAADYTEAVAAVQEKLPDLILLDWMLPKGSGIQWLQQLRNDPRTQSLPVMLLTARAEESDRVMGLDQGADDYLTKPFSIKELIARVKALLRRTTPEQRTKTCWTYQSLQLDPASHRITIDQQPIVVGPTEYKLLLFFMSHPEQVFTREQILHAVWGTSVYVEERTVDVHIRRLRKALEACEGGQYYSDCVQTVRSAGYRFSMISTA